MRLCIGCDWERSPHPPCALWAFESIQFCLSCAFCHGFSFRFWCTWLRRFVELFGVIPMLLAACQIFWNHELIRIEVLDYLRKPQSLLISPTILKIRWSLGRDRLGICSRGRAKQFPKFHRFSWSFGRDSPFESKFSGVFWVPPVRPVGKTGQTGPAHRSDRSRQISSAVFPIRFRFASWFRSLVRGLLGWFSFSITTPNFGQNTWGLGWFWDIGRRFKFRRNFDRLPFTHPLWSPVSVPQIVLCIYNLYLSQQSYQMAMVSIPHTHGSYLSKYTN